MRRELEHIDLLHEITVVLELYRDSTDVMVIRDLRKDLSVLAVQLSDTVGDYLQQVNDSEYQRKRAEDQAYLDLRENNTAGDAERKARIQVGEQYLIENECRGVYKTLDLQHKSILKVLDSMAAKTKEEY